MFASDHRRAQYNSDLGELPERDLCSIGRANQHIFEATDVFAEVAGIAHAHREALPTFDGRSQVLSTGSCLDYVLNIAHLDPVARCRSAIDLDLQVGSACYALGV